MKIPISRYSNSLKIIWGDINPDLRGKIDNLISSKGGHINKESNIETVYDVPNYSPLQDISQDIRGYAQPKNVSAYEDDLSEDNIRRETSKWSARGYDYVPGYSEMNILM